MPLKKDSATDKEDELTLDGYVSADFALSGEWSDADADSDADSDSDADDDRMTEESVAGNIFRVLDSGEILNYNQYRGLQVVDVSEPAAPAVMSRVAVFGTPKELFVAGDIAIILVDDWVNYQESTGLILDRVSGSVVMTVNLSDSLNPTPIAQQLISGRIIASQLVTGEGGQALYLAVKTPTHEMVVQSYRLDVTGQLTRIAELNMGEGFGTVTATPSVLLAAKYLGTSWDRQEIAFVDIADTGGQMAQGGMAEINGVVAEPSDMSLQGNILRVVAAKQWDGSHSRLLTFDVSDLNTPVAVDEQQFGDYEALHAVMFLENSGFFVTKDQTTTVNVFEIDGEGNATEMGGYDVSGNGDVVRPVFGGNRIVAAGLDDGELAVSLLDANVAAQNPLIAHVAMPVENLELEGEGDDCDLSVLENAVSVVSADDIQETGLVLVSCRDNREDADGVYFVRLVSFSAETMTLRGEINHHSSAKRVLKEGTDNLTTLSEETLGLFNFSNPDAPASLGYVDLAASYNNYFPLGDYGIRVRTGESVHGRRNCSAPVANDGALEVVNALEDLNSATPLARVPIASRSTVLFNGIDVAVISQEPGCNDTVLRLDFHRFEDPQSPEVVGTLSVEMPDGWWGEDPTEDRAQRDILWVGNAIVIPATKESSEVEKEYERCNIHAVDDGQERRVETEDGYRIESNEGTLYCEIDSDGNETCEGEMVVCYQTFDSEDEPIDAACDPIDPESVEVEKNCSDEKKYRYWSSFAFQIVDISNPSQPVLLDNIEMPAEHEAGTLFAKGESLLINTRIPEMVSGDDREYVRHYVTELDLSDPGAATLGTPINFPGEVLAADGEFQQNAYSLVYQLSLTGKF